MIHVDRQRHLHRNSRRLRRWIDREVVVGSWFSTFKHCDKRNADCQLEIRFHDATSFPIANSLPSE